MSRRIPISSPLLNNNQQQQGNNSNQQGGGGGGQQQQGNRNSNKNWQTSSLDLVFSFSRSQAFFGSNLPSSPSFVARYRRPTGYDEDEEEGEDREDLESQPTTNNTDRDENLSGGARTGSEDRDESIDTTTTDEGSWSEEDEEGEEEEERRRRREEEDEVVGRDLLGDGNWDQHQEVLPRNAVGGSSNLRSSKTQRSNNNSRDLNPTTARNDYQSSSNPPLNYRNQSQLPSNNPSSLNSLNYSQTSPPTERTHLLVPKTSTTFTPSSFQSFSASELNPNPHSRDRDRRLSVISGEFWAEAVEESRGKSTYGQTLFNTTNVLVGVGLLALPLSFAEAGWVLGTAILLFCATITNYTAKILARIMARDNSLETYSDVLVKAFGPSARTLIHSMFVFELGAFGIALIILFSDSMSTLYPVWEPTSFKLLAFIIILPSTFLPLRFLSMTSLIGILSSFTLLIVLIADGSIKTESPGSLWEPLVTSVNPRWMRLPLSFGLFMSGFSGHAVIPSLVRDMKDPREFDSMINVAYMIAVAISFIMGAVGYCMFGNDVSSEITRDMLLTTGFPDVLNKVAMWMIAINPVVKYALISRALSSTLEHLLGIGSTSNLSPTSLSKNLPSRNPSSLSISSQVLEDSANNSAIHSEDSSSSVSPLNPFVPPITSTSSTNNNNGRANKSTSSSSRPQHQIQAQGSKTLLHHLISPMLLALIILLAILIPDFGRVLSFLGSASAFLICCIGPLVALLILGKKGDEDDDKKLNFGSGTRTNGRSTLGGEESSQGGTITNISYSGGRGRSSGRKVLNPNSTSTKGFNSSTTRNHFSTGEGEEEVWIVSSTERGIGWILLLISIGFCVVGTVWTFLPLDVGLD